MTEYEIIERGCEVARPITNYNRDWRRRLCFAMARTLTGEWDRLFGDKPDGFDEAFAAHDVKKLFAMVFPYMSAVQRLTGWPPEKIEEVYDEILVTPDAGLALSVQSIVSNPEKRYPPGKQLTANEKMVIGIREVERSIQALVKAMRIILIAAITGTIVLLLKL